MKWDEFDYVLTAHHAGDVAETLLLNLIRSQGSTGMADIAEKRGMVVRPLLPFTREEIMTFALEYGISYREDKSNHDDHYRRNFIRLHIVPLLRKLNPDIDRTFSKNAR